MRSGYGWMFSRAPGLQRHVCARCRLRQTLRSLRADRLPRTAALSTTPVRRLGTSSYLRQTLVDGQRQARSWQEQEVDGVEEGGRGGGEDIPRFALDDGDGLRAESERYLPDGEYEAAPILSRSDSFDGQLRVSKYRRSWRDSVHTKRTRLPEPKVELQVDSLGEPASIIHLKPKGKRKARLQLSEQVQDPSTTESFDILRAIEDEGSEVTPEEVFENIHLVRDRWLANMDPNAIPTQTQCIEVYDRLMQSFTVSQLQMYQRATVRDEADDFDDLQGVFISEICSRSKWYPGKSNMDKTYAERIFADVPPADDWKILVPDVKKAFRHNAQETLTKKPALCEAILRRSWKLRSAEEAQKVGEMDVAVRADHLTFLESRYDILHQLERQLAVKIEHRREKGVFRIRGGHTSCGQAFTALYAHLSAVRVRRLDLAESIDAPPRHRERAEKAIGSARLWKEALLDEIGSFTKSRITPVKDRDGNMAAFDVTFLAPQRPGGAYETRVFDNVRRIIDELASDISNYTMVKPIIRQREICYTVPVNEGAALPVYHRSTQWQRFRCDVPKHRRLPVQDLRTGARAAMTMLSSWHRLEEERSRTQPRQPQKYWADRSSPYFVIRTGKLAFDGDGLDDVVSAQSEKSPFSSRLGAILTEHPRVFVPSSPGGLSSFEHLNEADVETEQRILLILRPSQLVLDNDGAKPEKSDASRLPDLHVELASSTGKNRAARILGVKLVANLPPIEVMMPSGEFDMQLTSAPFIAGVTDDVERHLLEYVDQLVVQGGRLDERSAAPNLELAIPILAAQVNTVAQYGERFYDFMLGSGKTQGTDSPWKKAQSAPTAADLSGSWRDGVDPSTGYGNEYHLSLDEDERPPGTYFPDSTPTTTYTRDNDDDDDGDLSVASAFSRAKWKDEQSASDSNPHLLVRYRFAGVEYHSRLRGRHNGYPLTYSLIDAGGIGGRYEQLALEARASDTTFVGMFDAPVPDRQAKQPEAAAQPVTVNGADASAAAHFPGDDPDTLEAALGEEKAKGSGQSSLYDLVKQKAEASQGEKPEPSSPHYGLTDVETLRWYDQRRKENPGLDWFMEYFQTALSIVRKSH